MGATILVSSCSLLSLLRSLVGLFSELSSDLLGGIGFWFVAHNIGVVVAWSSESPNFQRVNANISKSVKVSTSFACKRRPRET